MFYKFHSFTLECLAFLATWYVIDLGINKAMKYFECTANRLVESNESSGQIVIASAPDERARALVKEQFRLDDYDLGSTLDADEVPRLESSNGRLLLIWKVPLSATVSDTVELGVITLGICLNQERLAFVRASGDVGLADREFRSVSSTRDVMLALLLRTVRHFVAHLRAIRQISKELEKKITVSMENKHLLQMFSLSEDLVYYQDAIEGNAAVISKLRGVGFSTNQYIYNLATKPLPDPSATYLITVTVPSTGQTVTVQYGLKP